MKNSIFVVLVAVLIATGCSNDQPKPEHPITITAIPHSTVKVTGHWKMGEFVIGYRIITDDYVVISDGGGLFGQEGQAFGGPGLVKHATVSTFGRVVEVAERVKGKEPITFYGDLAHTREGNRPYLFEGKKVIILLNATHNGQNYEVNRRPWDN